MKQYDSYLILGCHFPRRAIEIIENSSSLKFFNKKIRDLYNCEILDVMVPINDTQTIRQYYLRIIIEQSDESIIKLENIGTIDKIKFNDVLDIFELDKMEPYLIAIHFIRELPNYLQ